MEKRKLGASGPEVSAEGLGCMGMSEFYGSADEAEAKEVINRALDLGVTFLDTADMYGPFTNEKLVGEAIAGRRDEVVLATKFGNVRGENGERLGIRGDAEYVRRCCEDSLRRLGVERIDLYYQHRVDAEGADRGDRRRDGGAGRAGQGRPPRPLRGRPGDDPPRPRDPPDRRPADRVLALEPRSRGRDPAASCASSGSASSPTARSAAASSPAASARSTTSPRTTSAASTRASKARTSTATWSWSSRVEELAEEKGVNAGQLALAWVLAQGNDIVPIPGTKHVRYLEQNVAAAELELSDEDLRRIDEVAPAGVAAGDRYADMSPVNL